MRTQKVTVKSRRRRRVAIITVLGSLLVAMALPLTGYVANEAGWLPTAHAQESNKEADEEALAQCKAANDQAMRQLKQANHTAWTTFQEATREAMQSFNAYEETLTTEMLKKSFKRRALVRSVFGTAVVEEDS